MKMSTTGNNDNQSLRHRTSCVWRTTALLALAVCVLALIPATSEQSDAAPGKCGDSVSYEIVGFETLRITGSGAMYDYSGADAPWAGMFTISEVTIGYGVTHIGDNAFRNSWISSVSIPGSVTSIGEKAFYGCSSLGSVALPSSVRSIGEEAFCKCLGLKSISIPSGVAAIEKGTFSGCMSLGAVSIPTTVKRIGDEAFMGCTSLSYVTIPASVTAIGAEAFSASGLRSVTVPDGVGSLGRGAFSGCGSLASVVISGSVKAVSDELLYGCQSLTSVKLGSSVTTIGKKAFYWCSALESVSIPSTVASIGDMAFYGCMSLSSAGSLGSVKSFGEGSFCGCPVSASVPAKARTVTTLEYDGLPGYSDLSAVEKRLYDAVAAAITKGTESSVKLPSGMSEDDLVEYAITVMEKVQRSLKKDYRQVWDEEDGYDFMSNVDVDPSTGTIKVLKGTGFDRSSYDKTVSALRDVKIDSSSRYAQVRSIHDYVCDLITYNYADTVTHKYHCIYNAIIGDHMGVCESYAAAFKMLCDIHGIPCVYVAGLAHAGDEEGHTWNFVQMEDGNWYFVDATWDDTGSTYSYFLRGSAAMKGRVVTDIVYPSVYYADYKAPSTGVPVTGVDIDRSSVSLSKGESLSLTATVRPADATDKTVTWTSSNIGVATVSNGTVKAVGTGSATITVRTIDGGYTDTCSITVAGPSSVPVSSVSLDRTYLEMHAGGTYRLTATISPSDATDKSVSWASSNPSAAAVDQDGNVKAVSAGSATITVTTHDGSKTASCSVSVFSDSIPAKGIKLNRASASLYEGGSIQLIATLTPSDSTDAVAWKSSNANVATVDQSGNVTAVSKGTATITASSGGGFVVASCMVTVSQADKHVTGISLSKDTLSMGIGDKAVLTATLYPADASLREVDWSSDNSSVATVDQDGNVRAVSPGKAKITAISVDGAYKAYCEVTVQEDDVPVSGITLDKARISLKEGSSQKLTATIAPANASLKEVDWMTSDASVATVDQDGNVKAVSPGKATITAISVDKALKAYCEVTVEEQPQGGASGNLLLYAGAGIVAIVAILGAALFLRGKSK